jgi:SsrA-binding protein
LATNLRLDTCNRSDFGWFTHAEQLTSSVEGQTPAPKPKTRRYPYLVTTVLPPPSPQMARAVPDTDTEPIARNRRARHEFQILESWEAGLVLTGTEVKALRNGKATLSDAYGIVKDGEVFLLNLHIAPYEQGHQFNHEPTRTRKLLLHKKEIRRLIGAVERQGLTLIPLDMYFKRGRAKVVIGLARGKKLHDKRADERRRSDERDMARAARIR